MEHGNNFRRPNCCFALILAIILGITVALLWAFGLITGIRFIVPYAVAATLLILALTTLIAIAKSLNFPGFGCECLRRYVIAILIAASIFLIFALIYVGTALIYPVKIVLAFVGSISFWTMLITFVAAVICLLKRPC